MGGTGKDGEGRGGTRLFFSVTPNRPVKASETPELIIVFVMGLVICVGGLNVTQITCWCLCKDHVVEMDVRRLVRRFELDRLNLQCVKNTRQQDTHVHVARTLAYSPLFTHPGYPEQP